MANVNGAYGEKIWERKINEQNEVGVIHGVVGSREKIKKDTQELMRQIDSSVIPLVKEKGKVLDLGVGPLARFSIEFSKRGFKVTGLDISATTLGYSRKHVKENKSRVNLIKGDITELDKVPGKFNFIYCLATFYHIPPHLTGISLMKINDKLEDGGYALVEFGIVAKKTLKNILWAPFYWAGHFVKRISGRGFKVNISRFTKGEIVEMIKKSGFRIEKNLSDSLYLIKKENEL